MVLACCGRLLRASFLVAATPLLLTGSLLHHFGHRLGQSGIKNAEYAAEEWVASGTLHEQAVQSITASEEDQAIVADLEADATANGEMSSASQASAGEDASIVGEDEAAAATEAGTAAAVQEIPGVNIAADATEGSAIVGQEASAAAAALAWIKDEALATKAGAQAVADGDVVLEKEAEAGALQAAAATEEATSVAAKEQATQASLLAGGFFLEAALCQVLSLAVQTPVALGLIAKWMISSTTGPCGVICSSADIGTSMMLPLSWASSRLSLGILVSSLLAVPWASTVIEASADGGSFLSQASSVAGRMVGLDTQLPTHTIRLYHIRSGGGEYGSENVWDSRRLRGDSVAHKHAIPPSFLNGLNPFHSAHVAPTTTVHPTLKPAPAASGRWEMFCRAALMTVQPLFRWTLPVLLDVGLISATFAASVLAAGVGKHGPNIKHGRTTHSEAVAAILPEAITFWLWGFMLLIAVWILSIMLAHELRPVAELVGDSPSGAPICMFLVVLCFCFSVFHGYVQSKPREDEEQQTSPQESTVAAAAGAAAACTLGGVAAEMALRAAEGPINAWAVGGSYKAVKMCWALTAITPWRALLGPWLHAVPPFLFWLGGLTCVVFSCGLLFFLSLFCHQLTRGSALDASSTYGPVSSREVEPMMPSE